MHLVMYLSSLIRSIVALHSLLSNKIKYKDLDDLLDNEATKEKESADKKAATTDKATATASPGSPHAPPSPKSPKRD